MSSAIQRLRLSCRTPLVGLAPPVLETIASALLPLELSLMSVTYLICCARSYSRLLGATPAKPVN
jgi:hypothetical protein